MAVSDPSAHQRVVALSLEAKEMEAEGPVMAFAMYALPAIAGLVKVTSHAVNPIIKSSSSSCSSPSSFSSSSSCFVPLFFLLISQPVEP